ncbi:MAG: RING finger protein [Thermoplasmata archaeon]
MRFVVPWAVALILIPLTCPLKAAAEAPELDMFVISSVSVLSPGESANFTVYTFIDGVRASFDRPIEAWVVGGVYDVNIPLPVQNSSPGIYNFCYTMVASHANRYGEVEIVVRASHSTGVFQGSALNSASKYITVSIRRNTTDETLEGFRARAWLLRLSSPLPKPGSHATFLCCITRGAEPVDIEGVRFVMHHSPLNGEPSSYTAEHTKIAPGIYQVNFTIPSLKHDDRFYLYAVVPGAEHELQTGAWLCMDFFTVIYHELGMDAGLKKFELFVSDWGGSPVRGAEVVLRVSAPGASGGETMFGLGKTDAKGRVRGSIPIPPVGDGYYIFGWANTSRFSQRFSGRIAVPGEGSFYVPSTSDFTVIPLRREPPLSLLPGESLCATYRAFSYGRPLASTELKCFVTSKSYGGSMLVSSNVECVKVQTDGQGGFSLNLTMPPGESSFITIYFKNPLPRPESGGYTSGAYDFISSSQPDDTLFGGLHTKLSRAYPGGKVKVTVSAPGKDLQSVSAHLALDGAGGGDGAWQTWSTFSWNLVGPDEEGSFSAEIPLPIHLKPGTNATLVLTISNETESGIEHQEYFRVQTPLSTSPETDLCCFLGLVIINITLIFFFLIAFINTRRTAEGGAVVEGLQPGPQEVSVGAQRNSELVPRRVALELSRDCALCGRRIARGNVAFLCSCGRLFHEHCTGAGEACPVCGRRWGKGAES